MNYDYQKLVIELRNKLVMSQMDFAVFLGISFASVNRWEKGHFEPSYETKRKIIKLCKENNIEVEIKRNKNDLF